MKMKVELQMLDERSRLVHQTSRGLPFHMHEEVKEHVSDMLKLSIEPLHSHWSFAIVLAEKKDGSTRFYVDYRRYKRHLPITSY